MELFDEDDDDDDAIDDNCATAFPPKLTNERFEGLKSVGLTRTRLFKTSLE